MMDNKESIVMNLLMIKRGMIEIGDYQRGKELLESMKINGLVNYLLYRVDDYDEQDKTMIRLIIENLQLIYNNSGVIPPIEDEVYDKLYELHKSLNGDEIIGAEISASNKEISNHKYPDLRGTLDKVHFIKNVDKGKDKRKSIEDWVKSVENRLGRELRPNEGSIFIFPKWDGLSVVFECDSTGGMIKALSRGDTQKNEALDLTNMFKGANFMYAYHNTDKFPDSEFGVKTEVMMNRNDFEAFCKKYGEFKSPRSAVSSILNSKDFDREQLQYLSIIPLQVQELGKKSDIAPIALNYPYETGNIHELDKLQEKFEKIREKVAKMDRFDIDGIVIRLRDENIQKALGREDNINKFEVAYKFPPEQKKTKLLDVIMSVGLLGAITPVAQIEPVKIKGNTISNISLGSIPRFESLNLREGQEVWIKYDVIPYLDVDDRCFIGTGKLFETPTQCPDCGSELVYQPILKCINKDCSSRIIGKIINYIEKMRISFISIGTVTTLYKNGFLRSIEDLYKLEEHEDEIIQLDGFGPKSFNNIMIGINARKTVYDYELLGAIGIPDIGEKIFKRILNIYYLDELIKISRKNDINKLTNISGIKEKTAQKIIDGIKENLDLLDFLCSELDIRRDERKYTLKVVFTKVRDKEFEEYLDSKDVLVLDNYNKKVDMVIVPNKGISSTKIDKARKDNKNIITIDEAYKLFGYRQ